MCGITGWVDFQQDLTQMRDVAQRMTRTLRARGPDAQGEWVSPRAYLGHRRLAVLDPEGGKQPMVASSPGTDPVVLTYSGEVYNFAELRQELQFLGHSFDTRSDTEVVLRAYQQWGAGSVPRLNGMFAYALWDGRRDELLLVRDRLGIKPLFYFPFPGGVLFGSEPKAILAHPSVKPVVTLEGLRSLLVLAKAPGQVPYAGMREVRPGTVVTVSRRGLREDRYWRLQAHPHGDDLPTTVHVIRSLLDDIVARQLVADVPLCTLLSGGLDSSAVTALAARSLRAQGVGPLRSFAVDFVGQREGFRPDEFRATPDAPFADEVARHAGTLHETLVLDSAALMSPEVRAGVLHARDLPNGMGDMDASLYLLFRAIRRHSTVALSGESADEVFGGYPWFHSPEARDVPTFPWLAAFQHHRRGAWQPASLLEPALVRALDMDNFIAHLYRTALEDVPALDSETGLERRMRQVCHLHLTHFLPLLLDRKDRLSMAHGLEVRVPFCDHRLVEYVFNAPWSMKNFDGREKSLLRAAVQDVLPASILARRKSPYPATQEPAYAQALRARVSALLEDGDARVLALLDRARVQEAVRHPALEQGFARGGLEMVLQLDGWLRSTGAELRW